MGGGYKKKPSGGHGGRGGDVVIRASSTEQHFSLPSFHIKAKEGAQGGADGRTGRKGKTRVVHVPVGTEVLKGMTRQERHEYMAEHQGKEVPRVLLADLDKEGDEVVVAQGGLPGRGNMDYAQRSFEYYSYNRDGDFFIGKSGEKATVALNLKSIADIGLVG